MIGRVYQNCKLHDPRGRGSCSRVWPYTVQSTRILYYTMFPRRCNNPSSVAPPRGLIAGRSAVDYLLGKLPVQWSKLQSSIVIFKGCSNFKLLYFLQKKYDWHDNFYKKKIRKRERKEKKTQDKRKPVMYFIYLNYVFIIHWLVRC